MGIIMKKYIPIMLLSLLPAIMAAQEDTNKAKVKINTNIPALSQYSEKFAIKNVFFNKRIEPGLKGELLEVEFLLENKTDDPMDLYIFAVATFEKVEKTKSSLERPVPQKERIRTFVAYPDDITNFTYPDTDVKGNVKKDKDGLELARLMKFPKNPKAGIDPKTGKPYHLTDKLQIYTTHLSKYRMNYFFFNNLAIIVFDAEGKPVFRQLYVIKGKRNR
jgi:hypothetical protein